MYLLDDTDIWFPNPALYHPENGIIAIGGDLSPQRLLLAYSLGIFPWSDEGEKPIWWSPDPRFVLFPSEVKISKSMLKILQKNKFLITENKCFEEVIKSCAEIKRKGQDDTWISKNLVESMLYLNQIGIAKSIEVWENNTLVGGFYGLEIGKIFCGESMFSKVSNASKAGFLSFVIKNKNYHLIDCQIHTPHLESLGAKFISKLDFLRILKKAQ